MESIRKNVLLIITTLLLVVAFGLVAILSQASPKITLNDGGPLKVEITKDIISSVSLRLENKACYPILVQASGTTPYAGERSGFFHEIEMQNEEVININLPLKGRDSDIILKVSFYGLTQTVKVER